MKTNKYTKFCAWVLLICFVAGQYMMDVHQHKFFKNSGITYNISKNHPRPATIVQEKCYTCDLMHQIAMAISQSVYFSPVAITTHIFRVGDYDFVSIALILSAGRAPPVMA